MSPSFVFTHPAGKLKQDVTSVTLVNNTAKTVVATVPDRKRWILLSVKAVNADDVTRTITINVYKEAAKTNLLRCLAYAACPTVTSLVWPNPYSASVEWSKTMWWCDVILAEGNTIEVIWGAGGASTGSVDADGLVIECLEIME